jgi:hypothetical protein
VLILRREYLNWARVVSNIVSPPIVWAVACILIASHDARNADEAMLWVTIYVVLVCFLPIMYIAANVYRGNIRDVHMPNRHERIKPFIVTLVLSSVDWLLLSWLDASPLMRAFAFFTLTQVGLMLMITSFWQISIHMISISGVIVTVGMMFGLTPALMLSPLILIVGAARLKLHRHTVSQVVMGTLVGASSVAIEFLLISALRPGLFEVALGR